MTPLAPRDILRPLVHPSHLAVLTMRCPFLAAVALAFAALSVELGLVATAIFAGLAEPYATLWDYVVDTLASLHLTMLFGAIVAAPVAAGGLLGMSLQRADRLGLAAMLLAPITILLPVAVWTVFGVLATVADTSFGLVAGKPAWIESLFITVPGSLVVLGVIAIFGFAQGARAARRARRMLLARSDECAACGYDLRAATSSRCPECGAARDPITSPRA